MRRARADFASQQGDLALAEREQRAAIAQLQANDIPVDTAIARAELAAILDQRGDRAGARALLAQALPVLRNSVLPMENSRASAEVLAKKLKL